MAAKSMKRNRFWDNVDVWASPVLANMLWIALCIFIVTMPLGIVGLIASLYHWGKSGRTQVFSIFFGTIRRVWLKAYLLFFLDLAIMALLSLNVFIFQLMDMDNTLAFLSRSATLFASLMFMVINIPAWVLLATWNAPLKQIIDFSLRLVFAEPLWMLGLVLVLLGLAILSLYLPAVVLVFFTGAVAAYIATKVIFQLVYHYVSPADLLLIEIA
jgi:uncharacterized membrane protein YesL